jgi:GNAT superfamily N-acetyltransferase
MFDYTIRRATVADSEVITLQRLAMFKEMGHTGTESETLRSATDAYFRSATASGDFHGWLVECKNEIVAGAGVRLRQLPPFPEIPIGGQDAHIINVYTDPQHRRRGLAGQLVSAILDWCVDQAMAKVTLSTSEFGRHLYERLGFVEMNEMSYPIAERVKK